MSEYYTLPSIYLGSNKQVYERIKSAYRLNEERFPSLNKFLEYLVIQSIENDPTLKRERRAA